VSCTVTDANNKEIKSGTFQMCDVDCSLSITKTFDLSSQYSELSSISFPLPGPTTDGLQEHDLFFSYTAPASSAYQSVTNTNGGADWVYFSGGSDYTSYNLDFSPIPTAGFTSKATSYTGVTLSSSHQPSYKASCSSSSFTVAFWLNVPKAPTDKPTLLTLGGLTFPVVATSAKAVTFGMNLGSYSYHVIVNGYKAWNHVALVFGGSASPVQAYVNGVATNFDSATAPSCSGQLTFFPKYSGSNTFTVADVRVIPQSVTMNDVLAIMQRDASYFFPTVCNSNNQPNLCSAAQ
jgi:hypothetical protein